MSSNDRRFLKSNGLSFKKTQKVKPLKKIPETDAILENVALANKKAKQNQKVARISIDSKARVKIGNLSRDGKSRTKKAMMANDHDYDWSQSVVPFGILDLTKEQLSI